MSKRDRRSKVRRGGASPWWGVLGLGLAGVAGLTAVTLLRPRGGDARRGAPGAEPTPDPATEDDVEVDLDTAWIPGPSGSLRVAECHPDGDLALIFVHGLAGRLEHWLGQLGALGPELRGLALDLPGHGESDPADDGTYSVDALAQSIGALVNHAGVRRCVLVAHSIGAQAALRYARTHPARVAGILLADPVGDLTLLSASDRRALFGPLRRDPVDALRDSFQQLLQGAEPSTATRVLDDFRAGDAAIAANLLESGSTESPLADLERLVVPVWSVTTPFNRQPNALHRHSPLVHQVDLSSAGHWLMMDKPAGFNQVLDAFLDAVRVSEAA